MIKTRDYRNFMIGAVARIKDDVIQAQYSIANDGLSMVRSRSIREGIDIDGIEGNRQPYSSRTVKATYLYSQMLNPSGRAYLKGKKRANWGKFRKAQGLSNTYINAYYTGDFFRKIVPKKKGKNTIIQYVGKMDKFEGLTNRFGDFLVLRNSELLSLADKAKISFYNACNRHF